MSCHYTGQASQFRGDQFLRFSPEESWLIARTEAVHGYDPHRAGRMSAPASPAPPVAPATTTRVVIEADSFSAWQLLQLLGEMFGEEEVDEEQGEGEDEDEGDDEDDFDEEEDEYW